MIGGGQEKIQKRMERTASLACTRRDSTHASTATSALPLSGIVWFIQEPLSKWWGSASVSVVGKKCILFPPTFCEHKRPHLPHTHLIMLI